MDFAWDDPDDLCALEDFLDDADDANPLDFEDLDEDLSDLD